jgi:outer membrane protein assembly factor BamB
LLDFAGDGHFELASAGYSDGVHVFDVQTGKVLWTLHAPVATCAKMVSADIDGRAGDELIYPAGSELCAVTGDRSSGRMLWKWAAPAALSMPAIADVDNDGRAEIIAVSADGTVYCIDGPPIPR